MKLEDALFNWLQIKVVSEARPNDRSAKDTLDFFTDIISEDHQVTQMEYSKDATMYTLRYTVGDARKLQMYPIQLVEQLLEAIENEPKFNIEE